MSSFIHHGRKPRECLLEHGHLLGIIPMNSFIYHGRNPGVFIRAWAFIRN